MVDLSPQGVHKFWQEYQDPMIYRVVTFMEGVEHWVLDGNEDVEDAMRKLGDTLADIGNIDLQKEDEFIEICVFISCGRGLRLLQAMDTAHPGAASKLLMHAEETSLGDDLQSIFLRRNIVFERLRLLGRVFSEQRINMILKALEDEDV